MELHSHSEIAAIEKDNWWYVSRRRVLSSIMKRMGRSFSKVLDLGCGVGSNLDILKTYAKEIIGLDTSVSALSYAKSRGYSRLLESSAERIPLEDTSIDLALCADVIEHVDDEKVVAELKRVLVPNGVVIVTTPAYKSLWNENDDYGRHLRRYEKVQLIQLFEKHGFTLKYVNFWNMTFFVPVWIVARFYKKELKGRRLKNNLSSIPYALNSILIQWMKFENSIGKRVRLPFGVSLIIVAEKTAGYPLPKL